jgi:hypothetical protein
MSRTPRPPMTPTCGSPRSARPAPTAGRGRSPRRGVRTAADRDRDRRGLRVVRVAGRRPHPGRQSPPTGGLAGRRPAAPGGPTTLIGHGCLVLTPHTCPGAGCAGTAPRCMCPPRRSPRRCRG